MPITQFLQAHAHQINAHTPNLLHVSVGVEMAQHSWIAGVLERFSSAATSSVIQAKDDPEALRSSIVDRPATVGPPATLRPPHPAAPSRL